MKRYAKTTKQKARSLRNNGWSLGEISRKMRVPKNTLSGWVKDIRLTDTQKQRIKQKILDSGAIGRPLAVKANLKRLEQWKSNIKERVKHYEKLALKDPEIGKLICGLLYLCEGAKYPASRFLYFGNSDPRLICFFLTLLKQFYKVNENKLRFDVNYRYDQNFKKLRRFWSTVTGIPQSKCFTTKPDRRTRGKPTLK